MNGSPPAVLILNLVRERKLIVHCLPIRSVFKSQSSKDQNIIHNNHLVNSTNVEACKTQ